MLVPDQLGTLRHDAVPLEPHDPLVLGRRPLRDDQLTHEPSDLLDRRRYLPHVITHDRQRRPTRRQAPAEPSPARTRDRQDEYTGTAANHKGFACERDGPGPQDTPGRRSPTIDHRNHSGCGWGPGVSGNGIADSGQHRRTVFAHGGDVAADPQPRFGAGAVECSRFCGHPN